MLAIALYMAWSLTPQPLIFYAEADNLGLLECICCVVDYDALYCVRWLLPVTLTASTLL